MWEPFTDDGRRAIIFAQEEVQAHHLRYIRPVYLLLGALRAVSDAAQEAVLSLGLDEELLRRSIEPTDDGAVEGESLIFTAESKHALESTFQCARELGHGRLTAGHLLLGILHSGDEETVNLLRRLGIDHKELMSRLRESLPSSAPLPSAEPSPLTQ